MIQLDGHEVKAGSRLWSMAKGRFVVIESVAGNIMFPIEDINESWTADGRLRSDCARDLYWDEVKIIPPPKPKRKVTREVVKWTTPEGLAKIQDHNASNAEFYDLRDSNLTGVRPHKVTLTFEAEE